MARIAMDVTTSVEVRARMFAELAGYVAPKRKAVAFDMSEEYRAAMPTRIEIVAGEFPQRSGNGVQGTP